MSYMPEAIRSYEPGIKATSWLTYFAFLFVAAMSVIYMCKMLAEEAEPEKKHKTTLWSVLTMVGTIAMLVMGIIYAVIGYKSFAQFRVDLFRRSVAHCVGSARRRFVCGGFGFTQMR